MHDLLRLGPEGPGQSLLCDRVLHHPRADPVSGALGEQVPLDGAGFVTHATGEPAEPETQTRAIEVVGDHAREHALEFADASILSPLEAVVLPGCVPRAE